MSEFEETAERKAIDSGIQERSKEQAKELITLGYLKPILKGFEEDEIKEEISSLIEGRM